MDMQSMCRPNPQELYAVFCQVYRGSGRPDRWFALIADSTPCDSYLFELTDQADLWYGGETQGPWWYYATSSREAEAEFVLEHTHEDDRGCIQWG